jgi:hypothetical protein
MADAFAIAAALTLAYLLAATIRGWWIQDRRDQAYTAHKFSPQLKGGESDDDQRLGLVSREGSLAGGQGFTGSPCRYCGEADGHHTGQCPVVSFGVVS